MAIVESGNVPGVSGISGGLDFGFHDVYPSWGPNRWEIAAIVAFDIAPLFTPFAFVSGYRKSRYLGKLIKAGRSGDKFFDLGRAGDKAADMQVASTLFAAGFTYSATYYGTPKWIHRQIFQDVGESTIMYYMDREGRIKAVLPSESVISQFKSRGDQGVVLPKQARRSADSFFDKDGIQRLSSFKRPRTTNQWSLATRTGRRNAAQHPLGEAPRTRGRSSPSRRANQITPLCPIHKRRHWCRVTRAMFS